MKICVYAICKNEMKFLDGWLNNMSEADYIVILDTGSTDGSFEFLLKDPRVTKVEQKIIEPWRFDTARNESMKLIPEDADVCVCTDPDELFEPGWADKVRSAWKVGETTRGSYTYAWSHNEKGGPENIYKYNKMHARNGYHWIYPCHEILCPDDPNKPELTLEFGDSIYLHHYQDKEKFRDYYLDLLRLSAEENKEPYNRFLYARELFVRNKPEEGFKAFFELLADPNIEKPENRYVLLDSLLQVAGEYSREGNLTDAAWYARKMIEVDPTFREPYLVLAEDYFASGAFTLAKACVDAAKAYTYRHYSWIEHSLAYSGWLEDVERRADEALASPAGKLQPKPLSD